VNIAGDYSKQDRNGFDYILTYCDDPQACFPTPAYNWMASSGVPEFVNKLHQAAKVLHEDGGKYKNKGTCSQEYGGMGSSGPIPAYA